MIQTSLFLPESWRNDALQSLWSLKITGMELSFDMSDAAVALEWQTGLPPFILLEQGAGFRAGNPARSGSRRRENPDHPDAEVEGMGIYGDSRGCKPKFTRCFHLSSRQHDGSARSFNAELIETNPCVSGFLLGENRNGAQWG